MRDENIGGPVGTCSAATGGASLDLGPRKRFPGEVEKINTPTFALRSNNICTFNCKSVKVIQFDIGFITVLQG